MTPQQFARAHNRYLQPPEEPTMNTCPVCDGDGRVPCSDCCDSEIRNGRCMECGDACIEAICSNCDGSGTITLPTVRELREEREPDREEG